MNKDLVSDFLENGSNPEELATAEIVKAAEEAKEYIRTHKPEKSDLSAFESGQKDFELFIDLLKNNSSLVEDPTEYIVQAFLNCDLQNYKYGQDQKYKDLYKLGFLSCNTPKPDHPYGKFILEVINLILEK